MIATGSILRPDFSDNQVKWLEQQAIGAQTEEQRHRMMQEAYEAALPKVLEQKKAALRLPVENQIINEKAKETDPQKKAALQSTISTGYVAKLIREQVPGASGTDDEIVKKVTSTLPKGDELFTNYLNNGDKAFLIKAGIKIPEPVNQVEPVQQEAGFLDRLGQGFEGLRDTMGGVAKGTYGLVDKLLQLEDTDSLIKYSQEKYGKTPLDLKRADPIAYENMLKEVDAASKTGELDKYKTSKSQDVLNIGEGLLTTAQTAAAPTIMAAFTTAGSTKPGAATLGVVGKVFGSVGKVINYIPGLSDFKKTLPAADQKRFDNFVGNLVGSLLLGTKGKKNIIKDPKLFIQENVGSQQVIDNFKYNVIGIKKGAQDIASLVKTKHEPGELAVKISQGKPEDIPTVIAGLKDIDSSGVKNYKDLSGRFGTKANQVMGALDEYLKKDTAKLKPTDTIKSTKVGNVTVNTNFVSKALDNLEELYTKNGDDLSLAVIKQTKSRFATEGLSKYDINQVAKVYGEAKNGFSTKTGEPLTSVTAQGYENTRQGIKKTFRDTLPDETAKNLDTEYSNLAGAKGLIDDMVVKVSDLEKKIQTRGAIENAFRSAGRLADIVTFGGPRAFLTSFLPSNIGNKVMNSLDIQAKLPTWLKQFDKAMKDAPKVTPKTAPAFVSNLMKLKKEGNDMFGNNVEQ